VIIRWIQYPNARDYRARVNGRPRQGLLAGDWVGAVVALADDAPAGSRVRVHRPFGRPEDNHALDTEQEEYGMEFFDSTRPALIPEGAHACLYHDGDYAASPAEAHRFAAVRWITVIGDYLNCGIADYEAGNKVYSQRGALRAFVQGRLDHHWRARVYCDRSNLQKVRFELAGLDYLVWLATLDGDKLSADYTTGLWGVQFTGGLSADYDTSVLYGTW
jgi:hypothetical protein